MENPSIFNGLILKPELFLMSRDFSICNFLRLELSLTVKKNAVCHEAL